MTFVLQINRKFSGSEETIMCEAENDLTFFGEVIVEKCEFCDEAFEDCECGEGEEWP